MKLTTAIIILITTSFFGSICSQLMTCPQVCSCIWRNGKQTTICENQNLISIPNQISPSTQVLDLNNNNFQILPSKAFQERGLINLQKLFLPKCKLGAIADDAFHQLTNLVELDLSDNLLTHVPVKALANATNLRRLLLNNNHIATITAESFAALSSLKFLNLSGCKTHTIEARAFYGLRDLEYLYLHDNQLTTMPYAVVADLPALYSFELYRNPWQCNCEMRPTREWMIRNNVGQSIPATCDLPVRISGLMWNSLDLDDFACEPDIITTTVEVAKVVGSNATLSCVVKGLPEPKVFWYMDHGYYNISSQQRSHKYHLAEERTEGTVNSLLTIVGLELSDDGTSFICSAENRAGIKSKNFTVYVVPSGTFGVAANWSKVELAGGVVGLLITLVLAFVVITLILIRSRKFPLYGSCGKSGQDHSSNDSLEKKKSLGKIFGQNGSTIYSAATNGNVNVGNGGTYHGMQQHALSMLGLDGIDKKPEIFLKASNLQPDLVVGNHTQQQMQLPSNSHLLPSSGGFELNHFTNGQPGHLTFSNDVLNGGNLNHQDTLFVNADPSQQYFTSGQHTDNISGLYRAVMVNPPSVVTNSTTIISAPQTNSSTMTAGTPNGGATMTHRASPPSFMLSAPNLYTNQYLSQYDLGNQTGIATPPDQYYPQQFLSPSNHQNNPCPSPLVSYGNPGFVSDSSTGGFIRMDHSSNMIYGGSGDNSGDDDDVFRSPIPMNLDSHPQLLEPLPLLTRQSTAVNLVNSSSKPNLLMEESIYGMRRPIPIETPNNQQQYGSAPMQMAPPAPNQQQSIYCVAMNNNNRWNSGGAMTPSNHFQQQQRNNPPNNNIMTIATSLSNIRCSPDEGYGEESSTGQHSVGQLEGTEV